MPKDALRRDQHLVSKGYQRNFSDHDHLSILDASLGTVLDRRRSIARNWRVRDFASIVSSDGDIDDSLEREFAKEEAVILNVIREISLSAKVTPRHKKALDALAAIHLVRSLSFAAVHDALVQNWREGDGPLNVSRDPSAITAFLEQMGRPPDRGEFEAYVMAHTQTLVDTHSLLTGGMRRGTRAIPMILAKSSIQLIGGNESLPGFILPDRPILHGKRHDNLFGFRRAGAVGDADLFVVPIHRRLIAFYTKRKLPNLTIRTRRGISFVNSLLVRGADSEIACHPDDSLATSQLIRNLDRFPPELFDSFRFR